MSHVIGRGRYAREVYPIPRSGGGGFPRVGYDQPIEGLTLPPAFPALFPRDVAGDPLRVTLPGVTPGNTLEVDLRFNVLTEPTEYDPAISSFAAMAVVTFDGSTAFPGTFQAIVDSWAFEYVDIYGEEFGARSVSSLVAVEIPVGATTAVVEVLYVSESEFQVSGANKKDGFDPPSSATLKVSEITAGATVQLGPGTLEPLLLP